MRKVVAIRGGERGGREGNEEECRGARDDALGRARSSLEREIGDGGGGRRWGGRGQRRLDDVLAMMMRARRADTRTQW